MNANSTFLLRLYIPDSTPTRKIQLSTLSTLPTLRATLQIGNHSIERNRLALDGTDSHFFRLWPLAPGLPRNELGVLQDTSRILRKSAGLCARIDPPVNPVNDGLFVVEKPIKTQRRD